MTDYLSGIPDGENAVVLQPPGEYAHYFWVLNYYFLPRRIYDAPAAGPAMEQALKTRSVRHAIHTRPDGFFFARWPAGPAP